MGRGNARFGCPKGTFRTNEHAALHYHVYVDYGDINEQEEFDNLRLEVINYIKAVCSADSDFQYPEEKWLDHGCKVIAESTTYGIAVSADDCYEAVFVYARECEQTTEEDEDGTLQPGLFHLALRVFWEMRYLNLRQRTCAWTSSAYQGVPKPT